MNRKTNDAFFYFGREYKKSSNFCSNFSDFLILILYALNVDLTSFALRSFIFRKKTRKDEKSKQDSMTHSSNCAFHLKQNLKFEYEHKKPLTYFINKAHFFFALQKTIRNLYRMKNSSIQDLKKHRTASLFRDFESILKVEFAVFNSILSVWSSCASQMTTYQLYSSLLYSLNDFQYFFLFFSLFRALVPHSLHTGGKGQAKLRNFNYFEDYFQPLEASCSIQKIYTTPAGRCNSQFLGFRTCLARIQRTKKR